MEYYTNHVQIHEMLRLMNMPHCGVTAKGMFRLPDRTMSRHEIAAMFYKTHSARRHTQHKDLIIVKKKGGNNE